MKTAGYLIPDADGVNRNDREAICRECADDRTRRLGWRLEWSGVPCMKCGVTIGTKLTPRGKHADT